MTNSIDQRKAASPQELRRNTIAGAIGVLVHWFDWAVYAYLATTISHVFFPSDDETASLLSVFAVFAVAFFVRPLGSVIFGHIGDTLGRKKTLSFVIITMAVGTLMIGLIPSHETIGIWAPILLIVARVIQGIAAGGEFGSAASFLSEYSPRGKRGFGTSWIEFGSVMGFLLASVVVAGMHLTLSDEAIMAWGWRVPFLLTVPLAAVGLWIRLKIEDTPEFQTLQEEDIVPEAPLKEVFQKNSKQFFQTIGIEIFMNCTFYVVMVYLITYQETVAGIEPGVASILSAVASIVAAAMIPLAGIWSDKIGRKPVLFTAAALLIVLAFPMFLLMKQGTALAGFIATFGLAASLALILGTHSATVSELFPTRTRQSGLSMAYSIAGAFFAGTLPYLNTWLIDVTGNDMIPAYTLIVVAIIGVITLLTIPETKGIALLHESDLAGAKRNKKEALLGE
ncbi:MFS transporter [Corynebacterium singulare]|uniref:Putative proline/betaine transporter n=1 Tax=Corynebacterium singulare TaxID=161899 RepID=A0A0B6EUB3_9CORY|nr:MFS transporter [Corynebacterium singulare]AJI78423.1 arabinose efflux permease family protein [Corynebacterium singulare]